jgi:hypothetical protein
MMNQSEGMGTHRSDTTLGRPTLHQTEGNRYPLNCGICGELYFVDEHTLRRIYFAFVGDESGLTISCEPCEKQDAEPAGAHDRGV